MAAARVTPNGLAMSRAAVVTGVSIGGIGWATAKVLIQDGIHVFGSVLSEQEAATVTESLGDQFFTALVFDIRNEQQVHAYTSNCRWACQV